MRRAVCCVRKSQSMNTNPRTTEADAMTMLSLTYLRKALNDQRGQVLPWTVLAMTVLLGMAGLTIDVGNAYVTRNQLQNATNAAALAAAGAVYNTSQSSNAGAYATNYSSGASTNQNYNSRWGAITPTITTKCLVMLMPSGSSCSGAPANAVVVTQTVRVPTTFMRLFGVSSIPVSATATTSMQGMAQPWNVAIIVDGSASMNTVDSNCTGNVTRLVCALNGIKNLLEDTNPCPQGMSSCTTDAANLRISLFTFPNVTQNTNAATSTKGASTGVAAFYGCNGTIPTPAPYTFPAAGATSYTPVTVTFTPSGQSKPVTTPVTYQVVDYTSDFYLASSGNRLNTSSNLVKAIGASSGCTAMKSNGGEGTYYAGVINAAQASLVAQKALYPKARNALILLSDGQAQASSSQLNSGTTLTTTGLYPSAKDECQQAIMAAQAATAAGTTVYAVAYGSESSGCLTSSGGTDSTTIVTGLPGFSLAGLTPCQTMLDISSSLATFYSDYNQSGSGSNCQDASHTVSSIYDIFASISANFTTPRLLPNDAQ